MTKKRSQADRKPKRLKLAKETIKALSAKKAGAIKGGMRGPKETLWATCTCVADGC